MELRQGYKQTEVGVIPEDWEAVTFRQVVENNRLPSGIYKDKNLYGSGNKIIKLGDVFGYDYFLPDLAQRVELSKEEIKNYRVELGDIFIALASVKLEGVGKVMLVTELDEDTSWDHNVALMRLIQGIDQKYIFYLFKSQIVRKLITSRATQVGTTFLKTSTILEFPIALPPKQYEQRAIASVLSDVDALIAKLDQLITKKRDLKQAAMQQLLTGQTRLPGFSGEWKIKRLGDLLKVRHGKSQQNVIATGGIYPILATGGEIGRTNTYLYDKPSVLIGRKGTIDRPQYQDSPFWTVDTLFYTELSCASHPKFVYFKFLMIDWRSYNEASGVPSLNASTIENIEISIPKYSEQAAIATILLDMDTEITALEIRRDKTRYLKQGMMQELLTGKIRLP
ncbi:MAG: restriction endonuclease subunit S [Methylococcaceae bacterium]|jgi:type I restriction enzyme, S subunit